MTEVPQFSKRRKSFRFSMKSLLLFFVIFAVVLASRKPVATTYHLWSLNRTWQRVQENQSNPQMPSLMAAHRSHVMALIQLGHFKKKVFYIGHLMGDPKMPDMQRELWDFQTARPQRGVVWFQTGRPVAIVYSSSKDMVQWSSIMASYNVRADNLLLPTNSRRVPAVSPSK